MDINYSRSADLIVMEVLGPYIDPQGMLWSDGVSQKEYNVWCAKNNSQPMDIRAVPWMPTKKEIVSQLYWIPNGRLSPPGLDYLMLDAGWFFDNSVMAVIILQLLLGAPTSGTIDDPTKVALSKLVLPLDANFVNTFCDEYEAYYASVLASHPADEARLVKYWPNRANNARVNAISIIRAGLK